MLVERLNKKGKKERERKEEEEGEKKRKKEEEERREGFECSMLSPVCYYCAWLLLNLLTTFRAD